jgi:uncharacterized protein (TIGR02147 family)
MYRLIAIIKASLLSFSKVRLMEEGVPDESYTSFLNRELNQRGKRNPAYSLRAFARDLGLAPSTICGVLNGSHGISRSTAHKIGRKLSLEEGEFQYFCDLVESKHSRSEEKRKTAKARLEKYRSDPNVLFLNKDYFDFIADWYHLAILTLMETNSFQSDPKWIAKVLKISLEEVNSAIKRLMRLNLIDEELGVLRLLQSRTMTSAKTSRKSMLQFHSDILKKAYEAVYEQTADERELSATLIAIPKCELDEARTMIREFRSQFCERFRKDVCKDEVYALTLQFFKISDVENAISTSNQSLARNSVSC